jgi:hypothetical protein
LSAWLERSWHCLPVCHRGLQGNATIMLLQWRPSRSSALSDQAIA